MNPALFFLWKLRWRSGIRGLWRMMKTPLGALLVACYLVYFLMFTGMGMLMFAMANELPVANSDFFGLVLSDLILGTGLQFIGQPGAVRTGASTLLAISVLLSIIWTHETAVFFAPAEVDYLFAGPFSRRELLTYKILPMVATNGIGSLLATAWLVLSPERWFTGCVGLFLTMVFIQLLSMALVLIRQTVFAHAYTVGRRIVLITVVVLFLAAVWESFGPGIHSSWWERLKGFQDSWAWQCFVAPFDVFGRAITAECIFPEFAAWGSLALAIDVALFAVILKLDANYFETALATAQRVYEILQRFQRGGAFQPWKSRSKPRFHLPQFSWIGGAGPIAWRQLTNALRTSHSMLMLLFPMLLMSAAPLFTQNTVQGLPTSLMERMSLFVAIVPVFMTSMLASTIIRYDFRGDIEYMDWLKMLPLWPGAIAAGQLITPILITTVLQLGLLGVVAAFSRGSPWTLLLVACFILPMNLLQFAIDNFCFLLYPARSIPTSPGDLRHLWRHFASAGVRFLATIIVGTLSASLGGIAYWLSGWYWQAFAAVAWLVLLMVAAAIVPCTAWAFGRFDVSRDLPSESN